jgi:hypothetical protein
LAGIVKRIGIDRYEKLQRVKAQALSGPDFLQRFPAEKAQDSGRESGRPQRRLDGSFKARRNWGSSPSAHHWKPSELGCTPSTNPEP